MSPQIKRSHKVSSKKYKKQFHQRLIRLKLQNIKERKKKKSKAFFKETERLTDFSFVTIDSRDSRIIHSK